MIQNNMGGHKTTESTTAAKFDKSKLIDKVPELITKAFPDFEILTLPIPTANKKKAQLDLLIELRSKDRSLRLAIKVKLFGYPSRIFQAIASFKQIPKASGQYPVIITDQISKEAALLARQAGIGYLDLVGNCYFAFEGLCVKKMAAKKTRRTPVPLQYLFSPKATRVIRTLIEFSSKSWPLVELAQLSNVSVGYAYKVARKLAENGFVQEKEGRIQLNDSFKLLNAWAQEYRTPSSQIASFLYPDGTAAQWALLFADEAKKQGLEFAFTLNTAVSLLTSHNLVEPIYLYAGDKSIQDPFWNHIGLKPVTNGGIIHILQPYDKSVFHNTRMIQGWPIVSRIQLYLDFSQKPFSDNKLTEFLNAEQTYFQGNVREKELVQEPTIKKGEDRSWRLILSKSQTEDSKKALFWILTEKLKLSLSDAKSIFKSRPIILFDQKTKQEIEELNLIFNQERIKTLLSNNLEDTKALPRVSWPRNITREDFK